MVEIEHASDVGESDKVYHELVSFLSSSREDLRQAAAEAALASLVSADDGGDHESNTTVNRETATKLARLDAVRPLCRIASSDGGSIDALAALSILCSHETVGNQCVLDFIEAGGIGRMIEIALEPFPSEHSSKELLDTWRKRVNYACALLANGTRDEKGAVQFVGFTFPEQALPHSRSQNKYHEHLTDNPASDQENVCHTTGVTKKEAKPTATLLLSRLLNPSFIDTSSQKYKSSLKAIKPALDHGEYDSDLDENDLEQESTHDTHDLQKQKSQPVKGDDHYDPYQHIAAVLMNITQLESGRNFIMKLIHHKQSTPSEQFHVCTPASTSTSTSHLQSILPELNSPNVHRRQGIAGTLKNCCFSQDSTWWLLNVVHIDKALLLPLAGPEQLTVDEKVGLDPDFWISGPSKVREPDALVRLTLTEALLLLLASGRRARETLRERRMYVVIKMADMVEENEEISERMNECVQYLRRDEEGEEEGSSDRRAYERYARGMVEKNGREWGGGNEGSREDNNTQNGEEHDYDDID